jgi:acyl dehydratase
VTAELATGTLTVGATAPPWHFGPITRTDIVRYAGASGDFNPIHHDETFAKFAGCPTVFSVGMFQAALLASFATDWLGAANIRRYSVRFVERVWPGDELMFDGSVVRIEETPAGTEVDVNLTCVRQTGAPAVTGSASFLIPKAPR